MNLLQETIASIVRKLLVILFGYLVLPLVAGGWLTSELGAEIRSAIDSTAGVIAATVVTLVVPLVWGWWQKVVAKARLLVAADSAPIDSADVIAAQASASVAALPAKDKLAIATLKDAR